jgi:hypothetical protein
MKKFTISAAIAGALAATALGLAGAAAAIPTGGANAEDVIKSLQADGYDVQLNGVAPVPLSRCTVTAVHGLRGTSDSAGRPLNPGQLNTVYVDFVCPQDI